jgi:hypothetical protein
MLMQLVCVDRRYQRMNCFNIRELQGVLKRKFFTDLINTSDHRDFLNQSMIGLRFKSNNNISLIPETESFFNLGTTFNSKSKTLELSNTYTNNNIYTLLNVSNFKSFEVVNFIYYVMHTYINNILLGLKSLNFSTFSSLVYIPKQLNLLISSHFNTTNTSPNLGVTNNKKIRTNLIDNRNIIFATENNSTINQNSASTTMFSETSNNVRFTKFQNPLISYDYKCGHYLGI